jgi:hypothetical protein
MKTIFHPVHRRISAAIITLLSSCLISLTTHASTPTPTATATATPTPTCTATAALPPPPKGVSVLNSNNRALRTGILTNRCVDMISLGPDWNSLEPTEGTYDWTGIDCPLNTINPYGKAVLLRIETMGGVRRQVTHLAEFLTQWAKIALATRLLAPIHRVLLIVFSITALGFRDLFQSFGIRLTWQKRKRSSQWPART